MSGAPPRLAVRVAAVLGGLLALAAVGFAADRRGAPPASLAPAPSASAHPTPPAHDPTPSTPPAPSASSASPAPPASSAPPAILPDGRVVLNLASEDDLRKLPGIGATRARAILALRQRQGKIRAVSDLLRVKGLGRKTLARLAPKMVVDPPPAPASPPAPPLPEQGARPRRQPRRGGPAPPAPPAPPAGLPSPEGEGPGGEVSVGCGR